MFSSYSMRMCRGEQPSPHDRVSTILESYHQMVGRKETEEKKMKEIKVSYTTITGEEKTKREYVGALESLAKSIDPFGGYSLAIQQEDGAVVEFSGVKLDRLRFLGGSFGFEEG